MMHWKVTIKDSFTYEYDESVCTNRNEAISMATDDHYDRTHELIYTDDDEYIKCDEYEA